MSVVYCSECGFQNLESAHYCSRCGALLVTEGEPDETTQTFSAEELHDERSDLLEELGIDGPALALLTVGGNDLLGGLIDDAGPGIPAFARALAAFLDALPIRPVVLGTVYDPTFGDDDAAGGTFANPRLARTNFDRMNATLRDLAPKYGALADIHAHFLTGRPDWFVRTIEPSLRGASEVRRCVLRAVEADGVL